VIRRRPSQELVVLVAYTVGLYMTAVDSTIIYTALPSLARDFHTSLADAQWVTLSYLLALAVVVPSSGWIGDWYGTRRTFLAALVLFTAASALCGLSGSLAQLILFRVLQGVGGGLIIPVGQAMLWRTFAPERRARVAGMVLLGTALGPATGPVLGGVLTTFLSWRWCFLVNLPFGAAALLIGLLFLAEHREPAAGRLDIPGLLLAGSGLALVLYALSQAPVRGWASPVIITTGLAGLAGLAALVAVELRSAAPMLNLRLLRNRIFRTTTLVSLCSMAAYSGYLFIMPEFLQQARGASALSSGLTTFPGAIGLLVSAQIAARLYHRIGPRRMAMGGLCGVLTVFCLLGLTAGMDTSTWLIRLLIICSGSAIAWCNIAVQTSSFATISPADTGRAAAVPDPGPSRRQHRPSPAGHRRRGLQPGRGHRRRAGPRVPPRLPHRRAAHRRRRPDCAYHPGHRRRRHHAPPGAGPGGRSPVPHRQPADPAGHDGRRVSATPERTGCVTPASWPGCVTPSHAPGTSEVTGDSGNSQPGKRDVTAACPRRYSPRPQPVESVPTPTRAPASLTAPSAAGRRGPSRPVRSARASKRNGTGETAMTTLKKNGPWPWGRTRQM
jgi:EmrB/QacA subfamily drug resistance transporter